MVANSHNVLARWRNHFSQLLKYMGVNDVRQTEIHTAEPIVPEPSGYGFELAIEKLKNSPGIHQIPEELVKAGIRTICYETHKLIISLWNKEELPEWKESITEPIYKGVKTDCSNYRGISLLPTTYKILSNILLSRLTPYAEEIIGDHQCGFRHNRSTANHIFCNRQILDKEWEYNKAVHQLLTDLKKALDSVRIRYFTQISIHHSITQEGGCSFAL